MTMKVNLTSKISHIIKKTADYLSRIFRSKRFFYIILGLFVIQAAWFALTARYPMAFDENYHFGIIKIYAHQWSPFITESPAEYGAYGDLTRYISYLYHYLMSFPYRLIALFVHNEITQIIILRFINIGLFTGGLLLFKRLFDRLRISKGIINLSFLALILIPVVPFLAATINYDNLFFILVPLVGGLALTCRNEIITNHQLPVVSGLLLIIIGALSSLVKYAFLPIFASVIIYLAVIFIRIPEKPKPLATFWSSFRSLKHWLQIILIVGLIIGGSLFIERYGTNLIKYHKMEPDCSLLHSVEYCQQYGVWKRNDNIKAELATSDPAFDPPVLQFVPFWFYGMMHRLYFAINYNYDNPPELPIPIITAAIIGSVGLILLAIFWRSIYQTNHQLILLMAISLTYIGAIFYINFTNYLNFKVMLAINGRYLIMVLPMLLALIGLAYQKLFNKIKKNWVNIFKPILSIVVMLLLLQGGGCLTYLVRGSADWYFQNENIINFNLTLKKTISPFIYGA